MQRPKRQQLVREQEQRREPVREREPVPALFCRKLPGRLQR